MFQMIFSYTPWQKWCCQTWRPWSVHSLNRLWEHWEGREESFPDGERSDRDDNEKLEQLDLHNSTSAATFCTEPHPHPLRRFSEEKLHDINVQYRQFPLQLDRADYFYCKGSAILDLLVQVHTPTWVCPLTTTSSAKRTLTGLLLSRALFSADMMDDLGFCRTQTHTSTIVWGMKYLVNLGVIQSDSMSDGKGNMRAVWNAETNMQPRVKMSDVHVF